MERLDAAYEFVVIVMKLSSYYNPSGALCSIASV